MAETARRLMHQGRYADAARAFEGERDLVRAADAWARAGQFLDAGRVLISLQRYREAGEAFLRLLPLEPAPASHLTREARQGAINGAVAFGRAGDHLMAAGLFLGLGERQRAAEVLRAAGRDRDSLRAMRGSDFRGNPFPDGLLGRKGLAERAATGAHLEAKGDLEGALAAYKRQGDPAAAARLARQLGHDDVAGALAERSGDHLTAARSFARAGEHRKALDSYMRVRPGESSYGEAAQEAIHLCWEEDLEDFRFDGWVRPWLRGEGRPTDDRGALKGLYSLGLLYERSRFPDSAEQAYRAIIEADPDFRDSRDRLARLLRGGGSPSASSVQRIIDEDDAFLAAGRPGRRRPLAELPDLPDLPGLNDVPLSAPSRAQQPARPQQLAPRAAQPPRRGQPGAATPPAFQHPDTAPNPFVDPSTYHGPIGPDAQTYADAPKGYGRSAADQGAPEPDRPQQQGPRRSAPASSQRFGKPERPPAASAGGPERATRPQPSASQGFARPQRSGPSPAARAERPPRAEPPGGPARPQPPQPPRHQHPGGPARPRPPRQQDPGGPARHRPPRQQAPAGPARPQPPWIASPPQRPAPPRPAPSDPEPSDTLAVAGEDVPIGGLHPSLAADMETRYEPAVEEGGAPSTPRRLSVIDPDALASGDMITGRYRIEKRLGKGGMATVFMVTDTELEERVALKLFEKGQTDTQGLDRFKQEMKIARRLSHPNIVRTFEFGVWEGARFITMEVMEGMDLMDLLKDLKRPLPVGQALLLMIQACDGLAAAHKLDIEHRDIKPHNMFVVDQGRGLKIMDFGIAKAAEANMTATATGMLLGTPAYMSPERIQGKSEGGSAGDLWALGATLYQILTLHLPFEAKDLTAMMFKIITEEPEPMRKFNGKVPEPVERITLSCLRKKPEERPRTARELRGKLQTVWSELHQLGLDR